MGKIEIIGLGAGDLEQMPLGIYKKLTSIDRPIYTRTIEHPVIRSLQAERVNISSFDSIYEVEDTFENVYQRIVSTLVDIAHKNEITTYTVPGHPMLAEKTVKLLMEQDKVEVEVIGGQSYLDDLFTALKIDPIDGFQFLDATSFTRDDIHYRSHTIFCQVYDKFVASSVKLTLLEDLPPDYEVFLVEAVGTKNEKIKNLPLEELDRSMGINNLTSLYVPPAPNALLNHTFSNLREVIRKLRAPDGCPWDREQTHESLRSYSIEEVYELIEAIDAEDDEGIVEELGDILMHVLLHSQIGEDNGYFSIDDVISGITNKMIYRHPHVFGGTVAETSDEVAENWEELKKREKGEKRKSILDGVPKQLPSLARAYQIQKKAAKVGFDWDNVEDIWDKLKEEINEVKEVIDLDNKAEMEKEFGDILFVIVNLARFYKINPEVALTQTNVKFISRFQYIEEKFYRENKDMEKATLEEMDAYWDEAKGKGMDS